MKKRFLAMVVLPLTLNVSGGATAAPLSDLTITTTAYIPSGYDASGYPLPYSIGDQFGLETVVYRYNPDDLVLTECNYTLASGVVYPPDLSAPCLVSGPVTVQPPLYSYVAAIGPVLSVHYSGLVNGGTGSTLLRATEIDPPNESGLWVGGTFVASGPKDPYFYVDPFEFTFEVNRCCGNFRLYGGEDGFAWTSPLDVGMTYESYNTLVTLSAVRSLPEPSTLFLLGLTFAGLGIAGRRET